MASENIQDLSVETFDPTVNSAGKPVLVDFWAPWCGPCKAITPILEEIASEIPDEVAICKVNVDDHQELAGKFNVRAIPTMILFKAGEVVDQIVGMATKDDVVAKVRAHA